MVFAAVEVRTGEKETDAIHAFFQLAAGLGLRFDFLEPYGRITVGSMTLLRFATDCTRLDDLVYGFQEQGRALILPGKAGYRVVTQTTEGVIPIARVQSAKTPGYNRRWRGTSNKFWQRQFLS